ncbi:FAD-dependent oxidoreductase [Rhodococcus opacus]|uniref:FAD-dependent oxidoreductase n=1 Tax=Rhodococcus opacus TaxID=37919 RepID=UPI002473BE5A|nr:FAD-dependent oxidoreductase [Rhodococcus opacus]MDH6288221.1 hypothetical protein [Rhodococcus opacus]
MPLSEGLTEHYDSVIYASGAEHDRLLNIPGEDLTGCNGSSKFVRWYNGHPDAAESAFELDTKNVVVVGAGNVARILARTAEELHGTDVPDRVLATVDRSKVWDIHVLIRRGPADAKVTPAELLQLSTLADATVLVHDGGHGIDNPGTAPDKRIRENLEILQTFAESSPQERRRLAVQRLIARIDAPDAPAPSASSTPPCAPARPPGDARPDGIASAETLRWRPCQPTPHRNRRRETRRNGLTHGSKADLIETHRDLNAPA